MDTPKRDVELRYNNVTLHSQERKEHGTLFLRRHHMVFIYHPEAEPNLHPKTHHESNSTRGTVSTESSNLTETSENSVTSAKPPPKKRPKDIWIPYPMIKQCILRLSHLQGRSSLAVEDRSELLSVDKDSDLFPPTFGTSTYERPSTDSARLAPYASPNRPSSPNPHSTEANVMNDGGRQPAIRIRRKDFQMMALHFHPAESGASADESARQAFQAIRNRCCVDRVQDLHAFHFRAPKDEISVQPYDARREFARMGISDKAAEGVGCAWRISDINHDYAFSPTYPNVLCVPRSVSDNMLKYGGAFRSKARLPCLSYLHTNGGSITRSSQPLVGVRDRRNPQDERLVSAIFSSHMTPLPSPAQSPAQQPSLTSASSTDLASKHFDSLNGDADVPSLPTSQSETALDDKASEKTTPPKIKVYGSTRRNLIVDARPKMNVRVNKLAGGGIEDPANYTNTDGMPAEKEFLNIENIHEMRKSLDVVFNSFANSDYINMKPDQGSLRSSGWLGHIANMIEGAVTVARVVGLGGSHVLVHCSDGWDRTAQVAALAQIMLDPYYRTFDGFITLIRKDFESFGHKFKDRNGVMGHEKFFEVENERINPSRIGDANAFGAKALSGAKSWFEKGRGSLFRQQNNSKDSLTEQPTSGSITPPSNPIIHSNPSPTPPKNKSEHAGADEVAPIFHQFLDAVYQLQQQQPSAFEFNDRFLKRLFYHSYACQYADFLSNTEQDRARHVHLPSMWSHFQSRRQDFLNPAYTPNPSDPLLFPKRRAASDRGVDVRWWYQLFNRKDEDMNVAAAQSLSFEEETIKPEHGNGPEGIEQSSIPHSPLIAPAVASLNLDDSTIDEHEDDAEKKVEEDEDARPWVRYDGDPLGVTSGSAG